VYARRKIVPRPMGNRLRGHESGKQRGDKRTVPPPDANTVAEAAGWAGLQLSSESKRNQELLGFVHPFFAHIDRRAVKSAAPSIAQPSCAEKESASLPT